MKIGIINSLYFPHNRGGAESIVALQAQNLRDQGHDVFIISTNIKRRDVIEEINGSKVYRLDPRNIFTFYQYNQKSLWLRLMWLKIDLLNVAIAYKVKRIIKEEQPNVVYTHNLRGLSYFILHMLKVLKIRNIHTLHDIQYVYPSGLLIKGEENRWYNTFFLRKWYEGWCRHWLASPSQVIAPSQWLMDFYIKRAFFKQSDKKVVRPFELGSESIVKNNYTKPINLVYVGLIEKHKGILWAVETLKNSQLEFKLNIYGIGSQIKLLKILISNDQRFEYNGELTHGQVGETFAQADISLVPSLTYENAPTVIYESLQAGTPVLASAIGGIPEIIQPAINGWLLEPGSKNELLSILQNLVS